MAAESVWRVVGAGSRARIAMGYPVQLRYNPPHDIRDTQAKTKAPTAAVQLEDVLGSADGAPKC